MHLSFRLLVSYHGDGELRKSYKTLCGGGMDIKERHHLIWHIKHSLALREERHNICSEVMMTENIPVMSEYIVKSLEPHHSSEKAKPQVLFQNRTVTTIPLYGR